MTGSVTKRVLTALLIVGLASMVPPGSTVATFSDSHNGEGSFTAVDNFGGGGSTGPTADPGGPYTVFEGNNETLDGSDSTGQGDPTYSWAITSGPGTLVNPDSVLTTYVAPNDVSQDTTVKVELTVTDNHGSDTEETTISVEDTGSSDDTTPPTISSFEATESGGDVTVTIDSDEELASIEVEIRKNNGQVQQILTEADFATSDTNAPFTYTATTGVSGSSNKAVLTKALDAAGNEGSSGQESQF